MIPIKREHIEKRIYLANNINHKVLNDEYHEYNDKLKSGVKEIDDTLFVETQTKDKTNGYDYT